MRPKDEKALVELAKHRNETAISELYRRNVDAIYQYVAYRVNDTATAEDITAEVFLRAVESIEGYVDTGAPFSAWLFRIARARVIDHWRRQQRHPQTELDESMPGDDGVADALPVEVEVPSAALRQAIRLLSEDQLQVIVLKFAVGLSNSEIAHILDKTEGAIKALQHRGLASLSRILEAEL